MRSIQRFTGPVLLGLLLLGCVPQAIRQRLSAEGEPAPAIEGPGLDGRVMRLSDQRGKVVLLSFWHGN